MVDGDVANLPDDVDALKAALTAERAKMREIVAERDAGAAGFAVARAKASDDLAMIAHQKLRIAKLQRQLYGPHSERSARLIDHTTHSAFIARRPPCAIASSDCRHGEN